MPSPPPGRVPPPPGASFPLVADIYYQRLHLLREQALQESSRIQALARGVAAFLIAMTLVGGLASTVFLPLVLAGAIPGQSPGSFGSSMLILMGGGLAFLLFLGILIYAIVVLVKLNGLFQANYDRAFDLLRRTDLPVMLVEDPYWSLITDQLSKASVFNFGGKSNYKRLEDHLSFCAFHLDNLAAVQGGQRDFNVWRLRWADSAFHNQKIFRQRPWVYWVGGCLTLVFRDLLWIVPVLFLIWCTRFVASRGVLVAFCEYFQQEQPASPLAWYPGPR